MSRPVFTEDILKICAAICFGHVVNTNWSSVYACRFPLPSNSRNLKSWKRFRRTRCCRRNNGWCIVWQFGCPLRRPLCHWSPLQGPSAFAQRSPLLGKINARIELAFSHRLNFNVWPKISKIKFPLSCANTPHSGNGSFCDIWLRRRELIDNFRP